MRIPHSLSLAVFASLTSVAGAQNTFVVPSKAGVSEPGSVWNDRSDQVFTLWGSTSASSSASRAQYLYDVTDIPVAQANLSAMQVRAPWTNNVNAATYTVSIDVSVGPNTPTGASSVYASNHGSNQTTVFSGALNIPAQSRAGSWPANWFAPIAFNAPFAYDNSNGASLVVDWTTTNSSTQSLTSLEGYRLEGGNATFEYVDRDCPNSAGQISGGFGWSPTTLVPGGSFQVSISGAPPATPSYASNAIFFATGGVGTPFGAFTTPFALTSLGLPAQAGCDWAVSNMVLGAPGMYRDFGTSASVSISNVGIPNDPNLVAVRFYTQALGLDLNSGSPMLHPLTAIRWTIGTGAPVPVSQLRRTFDASGSPPTSSSVVQSDGLSAQFIY